MTKVWRITPRFHEREIVNDIIHKNWDSLSAEVMKLGKTTHDYMQKYINKNRKRSGGTGNLANSVNFFLDAGSKSHVFWGVGDLDILNARAKEWYVVNYGKTVAGIKYIPYWGNFAPGYFRGGDGRPKAKSAGKGREGFSKTNYMGMGMFPKNPIRPMHYIQTTRAKLTRDLRILFTKIRKG